MLRALDEYEIAGCKTTIPFCEFTLKHKDFVEAKYDTHFVKDNFNPENLKKKVDENILALAATLLKEKETAEPEEVLSAGNRNSDWWLNRR
jgi:propionyl-CoA carboxylase alpha chain